MKKPVRNLVICGAVCVATTGVWLLIRGTGQISENSGQAPLAVEGNAEEKSSTPVLRQKPQTHRQELPANLANVLEKIASALRSGDIATAAILIDETHENLEAPERIRLLRAVAKEMSHIDPKLAGELIRQLPENGDQLMLATESAAQGVGAEPARAAQFALMLEGNDFARNASQTVAREWSKVDAAAAVRWINELPNEVMKGAAVEGVAATLASQDLKGALDWANDISDPYLQANALAKAAKILANRDPAMAAKWAVQFPQALAMRQAMGYAVPKWVATDAAGASQWAASVADPAARTEAVLAVGAAWGAKDASAATQWASSLPDDLRPHVLAKISNSPGKTTAK